MTEPTERRGSPNTRDGTARRTWVDSLSMVNSAMRNPLDPGYAAAAAQGSTAPGRVWLASACLLMVVAGLALGTSVQALRGSDVDSVRTSLKDRVRAADGDVERGELRVQQLTADVDRLTTEQLGRSGDADNIAAYSAEAGFEERTGRGVVLAITDPPQEELIDGSSPRDDSASVARVIDTDVQVVVNSLWASGAEAISINGHRLTASSAIRDAGAAVLVNYRALRSPFVVHALGPADDMAEAFRASLGGRHLVQLDRQYGIRHTLDVRDDLTCPAGSAPELRRAVPLDLTATPTPKERATR